MSVKSSAGTTVKISASTPATFDAAGYNAIFGAMTTIGEVVNAGEFGRMYNVIKHNPLATRSTVKKKGSYDEGQINLQLGLDTDDAGQILLKAAVLSDNDYSFCVTTQSGDKYFFQAQAVSFKPNVGSVDQITAASALLEITSNSAGVGIVEVLA